MESKRLMDNGMSVRQRYYIKVIHIGATDSPNVRLGIAQKKLGLTPTDDKVIDGVLSYGEYILRLNEWDDVRKCIGLDGEFWEGAETLLYPPQWLDRAERLWVYLRNKIRIARGIGIDPGVGSANTAIAVVDEFGLIELISEKTKDTTRVIDMTLEVMNKYHVEPHRVLFDNGGGGKQYVDRMRSNGYNVRSVWFNDKPSVEPQRHMVQLKQKIEAKERKHAYFNKRAEMYGELRYLLDPGFDSNDQTEQAWRELATQNNRLVGEIRGFAISPQYQHLRKQLAPIPLTFELEKLKLPPKNKRDPKSNEVCLVDIIGFSPDEADALVLAIHAMQTAHTSRAKAGAM